MSIPFRPLGEVKMILEEAGTDVAYAYEDLVFAEHTAYLIQFNDRFPENLKIYFNAEIDPQDASWQQKILMPIVHKHKMSLTNAGRFSFEQRKDSEEIDIRFFPDHPLDK